MSRLIEIRVSDGVGATDCAAGVVSTCTDMMDATPVAGSSRLTTATIRIQDPAGRGWQEMTVVEALPPPTGPVDLRGASPGGDDNQVITPGTGAITISAGVPIPIESKASPVTLPPPSAAGLWLDSAAFFIPKSIREPFFGDLLEDLAEMAARGRSKTAVTWAAVSQVVVLILRWAWSQGLPKWLSFRG